MFATGIFEYQLARSGCGMRPFPGKVSVTVMVTFRTDLDEFKPGSASLFHFHVHEQPGTQELNNVLCPSLLDTWEIVGKTLHA